VDVLILPAALQVYLVTFPPSIDRAETQVGILTGQQDIAEYRAGYTVRTRSGVGVALVADWASIGSGLQGSSTTPFGTSDLWLKADYVPPAVEWARHFSSWPRAGIAGREGVLWTVGFRIAATAS